MPSQLIQRQPTLLDTEKLLALSIEAGWNQTADDWRLLVASAGTHGLSLWQGERPVASALALAYGGRFAWICMVLVTANWRGQGIATDLLGTLTERLTQQGLIAGLDATEAGRTVYRPLGFNEIYTLSRLLAPAPLLPTMDSLGAIRKDIVIQPLSNAVLAALAAWDAPVFGAERYTVLEALHSRLPQCAFIARTAAGEIVGYVLGRDGSIATQLGPVVAVDDAIAKSLLIAALVGCRPAVPVLIDALDQQQSWLAFLHDLGFVKQRGFSRMLRDRDQPLAPCARLFAITGPEFG